jgi:polyhydroxyalkanoate synthesis repressor PhaR
VAGGGWRSAPRVLPAAVPRACRAAWAGTNRWLPEEEPIVEQVKIFKKYANRRLYDTEQSKYVTINEVADFIKAGRQVQVLDAKTNEDVTAFILTQVVLEAARRQNVLLPVPVLELVIRYGDNLLGEFFEKYFQLTLKNYLAYKSAFDQQFKTWLDLGMDVTDFSKKSLVDMAPYQSFLDFIGETAAAQKGKKRK